MDISCLKSHSNFSLHFSVVFLWRDYLDVVAISLVLVSNVTISCSVTLEGCDVIAIFHLEFFYVSKIPSLKYKFV